MTSQKRKGQKHQNRIAWEVKFDPKADEEKKKVRLELMCKRCVDQIMWKLQFGKYRKMTEPSRCNICQQKSVVKSYHKACDPCAKQKDVCSKCLKSNSEVELPEELPELDKNRKLKTDQLEDKEMERYMKAMRERSKRTVLRGIEKGTVVWNGEQRLFTDPEGQPIQNLKFKEPDQEEDFEDCDGDEDGGDDDFDDDLD